MAASCLWSNTALAVNARSERRSATSAILPRRRLHGTTSAASFSSALASNCCHVHLVLKSSHNTRISRIIVRASLEPTIIPSWDKSSLRFSEEATKVILLAQEETRRLGQAFVGTEQILLGLIGESTGILSKVFKSMGISLDKARVEVEKIVEGGSGLPCVETPFTPHAKRVLEFSMKEAQQYGHDYVETEHLLLGLLRYGKGVAIHVIEFLGVNPSEIKEQVIRMIGEGTILVDAYDSISKMVTLEEYGTNLTKLAQEGKLDPIVGRQKQIERVAQVIGRRTKNNPCLVGEPGVGKTAIVEGLAQWMVDDIAPESIRGKTVVALDMDLLMARTACCEKSEKKMEKNQKMEKIIDELKQRDDVILYIDKIHALVDENAIDRPTNILKLALARGEFQCIGATTLGGYKNLIARDPVLARRFQTVEVLKASLDETMEILKASRERYEIHHKVRYEDKALAVAARFSHQDISKAIDLIDEAGSRVRMRHLGKLDDGGLVVTEGDIVDIVSPRTRGPIENVSTNDFERLLHMEELELRRELEKLVAQGEKARPCVIESMLKIIQDLREFRMNKPR